MPVSSFYAGAARVDITPPLGSFVGVDFLTHYARFIHDPLHAKSIVFKDHAVTIAIVVVDICIMPTALMDEMKRLIEKETGISKKYVLISSTHTHAAGAVIGLLSCSPDLAYMKKLPVLVAQSVKLAKEKLRPAKIASGSVNEPEHVLCRRYVMKEGYAAPNPVTGKKDDVKTNPFGVEQLINYPAAPTDPGIGFLAVKGIDDSWIAVLGNYSLHYVGDWHVDSISADYFGEFSNQIKDKLYAGEDFVGMMSNGTSGDINIWDFRNPNRYPKEQFAKTKIIGGDLAQKVYETLQNASWELNPTVAVKFKELELGIRKPSAAELTKATQIVIDTENYNHLDLSPESMVKIYAREQVLLHEYPDTSVSAIQAIKIGNLIIGALGGEFFAETGLWLKRQTADKNYFTICLANTYDGYILPSHEIERGGYESWRARSSYLEVEAENKIRNELLRMIKKLG
jgi:neutral ceramidase